MFDYLLEGLREIGFHLADFPPNLCVKVSERAHFFSAGLLGREKSYIFVTFWPQRTQLRRWISRQILRLTFQLSIVLASKNHKDEDCSGRFHTVLIS
jgi:hypothetical protein